MRIALIGFGKMGREIDGLAREQGETIARVFEIDSPVRPQDPADLDVRLAFSPPDSVLSNIRCATEARRDIVIATTGWDNHLPEIRNMVKYSGLLYSSN